MKPKKLTGICDGDIRPQVTSQLGSVWRPWKLVRDARDTESKKSRRKLLRYAREGKSLMDIRATDLAVIEHDGNMKVVLLYSVRHLADELGYSIVHTRRLIAKGTIPFPRFISVARKMEKKYTEYEFLIIISTYFACKREEPFHEKVFRWKKSGFEKRVKRRLSYLTDGIDLDRYDGVAKDHLVRLGLDTILT